MTRKIVLLGVGSTYFTRSIIEGLIRVGGEWDVAMVDIQDRPLDDGCVGDRRRRSQNVAG